MNFDKLIAIFDADWDESKHPRAKNGQFGRLNSRGSTSTGPKRDLYDEQVLRGSITYCPPKYK